MKLVGVMLLIAGGATYTISRLDRSFATTPDEARFGWAGPEVVEQEQALVASLPQFQLVGDDGQPIVQDNANANVRHWEAVLKHRKSHLPNYPQQTGDCVSFGTKNVAEYLQYLSIDQWVNDFSFRGTARGPPPVFRQIATHYVYGYSRVIIGKGKLGRSAGSIGAWAAQGCKEGGLLALDEPGCPAYKKQVAEDWGFHGPPPAFIDKAKQNLVRQIAQVRSAEDCRNAICNNYPVTIASMFGTKTIRKQDDRMVARRDDSWAHQMAVIGYDGSHPSGRKYFYIINSWGETAHPPPLQNEPPGGFWVEWHDMEWICSQGDCWAYSLFDGFKALDLDFRNVVGEASQPQTMKGTERMFEQWLFTLDQNTAFWLAACLVLSGLACLCLGNAGRSFGVGRWGFAAVLAGGLWIPNNVQSAELPLNLDFKERPRIAANAAVQLDFKDVGSPATKTAESQPKPQPQGEQVQPAGFSQMVSDRPLLFFYGDPNTCAPCRANRDILKEAKDAPFNVIHIDNPAWYPAIIQQAIAKNGAPAFYYEKGGYGYIVHGFRSMAQINTMMQQASPPKPALNATR